MTLVGYCQDNPRDHALAAFETVANRACVGAILGRLGDRCGLHFVASRTCSTHRRQCHDVLPPTSTRPEAGAPAGRAGPAAHGLWGPFSTGTPVDRSGSGHGPRRGLSWMRSQDPVIRAAWSWRQRGSAHCRTLQRAVLVATLILSGCAGMGPNRLPADRFDYGAAIAVSSNEQMLLNLVRLRYEETPVFLDVTSVIAQYQFDARAQVGAEAGIAGTAGLPGDSILIPELGAGWSERPTITYAPRTGPKFIRSLLTPLPPLAVIGLVQGNWPVEDVVFGVVRSINGVGPSSPATGRWNPDYGRMLEALATLQRARAFGVRTDGDSGLRARQTIRFAGVDEQARNAIAVLRKLWNLDPGTDEYQLTAGVVQRSPQEIAVLTSSMLDLMRDIATFMEIPTEHAEGGRSQPTHQLPAEAPYGGRAPIRVQLSRERPDGMFVAVNRNDWWFSIDTNDLRSKRVLLLLNVLFQLAEGGHEAGGPVVTVPAGN